MADYQISGIADLSRHHFYRAVAWLGEVVEEKAPGGLAPRCVKDQIEEALFNRRRDLFTDLSVVFIDTTSLSFYGERCQTLGARGHSKDYRPRLEEDDRGRRYRCRGLPDLHRDGAGQYR